MDNSICKMEASPIRKHSKRNGPRKKKAIEDINGEHGIQENDNTTKSSILVRVDYKSHLPTNQDDDLNHNSSKSSKRPRGKKLKDSNIKIEPPNEDKNDKHNSKVTPRRGKKRKREDEEKDVPSNTKEVACGVCKQVIPASKFNYHKYSVHMGLARPDGMSQEFSEKEKKMELKKTIEKFKRVSCPKCNSNFTSALGFLYHVNKCGLAAEELENRHHECPVCGKKVMIIKAHMKTHENKKPTKETATKLQDTPNSKNKSKRAAAVKAETLINKIKSEPDETTSKKSMGKAASMFVEPASSKVTNSIIGAWKRQIEKHSLAQCRYPSCTFKSSDLNLLKDHHVKCEIGLNLKLFTCITCPFQCQQREEMVDHVIQNHVSEIDATFEIKSGSENEEEVNEVENYDDRLENKSTISRSIDKVYGLTAEDLYRFKTYPTSPLIPEWLARFHKKHFSWDEKLYSELQPKMKILTNQDPYLPTGFESMPFARRKISVLNLHPPIGTITYERLKRFEGVIQNGTPLFYCGGSVQCVSWCPMPNISKSSVRRDQHLAISVFNNEDLYKSASQCFSSKYMIQIWNCGPLGNLEPSTIVPKFALGLAHHFGRLWAIDWCPSGCYDESRLGLIAVGCSAGSVRIIPVPNPSNIGSSMSPPVYLVESTLTLSVNSKERSECTSLQWDTTKGHRFIVAGFANGTIALWDLSTKSPLLRHNNTVYPIWSFYAHSTVITGVALSPHHAGARFIASASTDRSVKLWDRYDPSLPVSFSKRSRVTNIKWRKHWPGILVCVEDVFAQFRTATAFSDFGYTGSRHQIFPQNSVAWCAAENEYMDIIAHCTAAGEVVLFSSQMALMEIDDKRLRKLRHIIFRTDLVDTSVPDEERVLNLMKKEYLHSLKNAPKSKVEHRKNVKEYAIVYNEVTTVVRSAGKQQVPKNITSDNMDIILPNDEPLTSINKLVFNPNLGSHTWMCLGGENGIVQLLRIDSSSVTKVEEIYLKEWNSL